LHCKAYKIHSIRITEFVFSVHEEFLYKNKNYRAVVQITFINSPALFGWDTVHRTAPAREWHCIEEYVNIGTAGNDDGRLKVWVDGEQKIDIDDMRFWNEENDNGKIGGVYFSTFHGGNSEDWAPDNDSYAQFDGFVLAENRVGVFEQSNSSNSFGYPESDNFRVYRNHSSGSYVVEFSNQESGIAQLELFSLSGQRLKIVTNYFEAGDKNKFEVDVDLIQNELYLFRFINDGRSRLVKMIH
jgi:hypothetical protein